MSTPTEHEAVDLDTLLDLQMRGWADNQRPRVEDLLVQLKPPAGPETLLDLIYNEIVAREAIGEMPTLEEYLVRYPQLEEELQLHFEVHAALGGSLLVDSDRPQDTQAQLSGGSPSLSFPSGPGDYDLLGELGRGGMGVVYRARHRELKRIVALKMFQPGRQPSQRELARFRSEAEAIARLCHVNIVQVYEIGQRHGQPYLALEPAEGGTLQEKLLRMPYQPRAGAELILTLAQAIQHAHENHVIHRDLKPANVLFTVEGTPKITDFGLAKLLINEDDRQRDPTQHGESVGTPRYMSPEQAAGRLDQISPQTDVYALGTLLYECLTGQVPFLAAGSVETLHRICHEEPVRPRRFQRNIPRDLETICLKCLHKEPSNRYTSAQALADDLKRFLRGEPIRARRPSTAKSIWMWCRRKPALATVVVGAAVFLLTLAILPLYLAHAENLRIAGIRTEVTTFVKEGQTALTRGDFRAARDCFQAALAKVQGEPALQDHELGIRGWLDQSHRFAGNRLGRERNAPPLFEERRDEAFLLSFLADPLDPKTIQAAKEAIDSTLEFTPRGETAWRREREALLVLKAGLTVRVGDGAKAPAVLEQEDPLATRLASLYLARLLGQLGKEAEATRQRQLGIQLAQESYEDLILGIEHAWKKNYDDAIAGFERVLQEEPNQFPARLLQAVCFLERKRLGEARVALTACIGERPQFVWSYLYRGRVALAGGNLPASVQDFHRAFDLSLNPSAKAHLEQAIDQVGVALAGLSSQQQKAFWAKTVTTQKGKYPMQESALLKKLVK